MKRRKMEVCLLIMVKPLRWSGRKLVPWTRVKTTSQNRKSWPRLRFHA